MLWYNKTSFGKFMNIAKLFKKENLFYTLIFVIGVSLIIINRAIFGFSNILWIVDFASLFSIFYVIFTSKHTVWGLVFDLMATCILVVTNTIQHLWLNLAVCVLIGIPNLTIGIITWKKNEKIDESKNLKTLGIKKFTLLFVAYLVVSVIFAVILYYLGGNLFYLDALYSAGCAVGVVLSSFAFIDQFYMFIFADMFGVAMYTMLTLQNINNITMIFTSIIFIVGNFVGLFNWRKLLKKQNEQMKANEVENSEQIGESVAE